MSSRGRRKRGSYKQYTDEQRDSALADVPGLGLEGAAKKHGIPTSTVGNWKRTRAESGRGAPAMGPRDRPRLDTRRARAFPGPTASGVGTDPRRLLA